MTNLDLPQISLSRYVDLLKRRKWQVVPVSLLGMIVGGLIAAAVPRYYVAFTEVRFNAEQLMTDQMRQLSDPLEELLASANHLIPARIPAVLQELGWPEAHSDDDDARAQFIAEVTGRTSIVDVGATRRNRSNTILRISYRDTDGRRAAAFANALREDWVKTQLDEVEANNREERRQVQERKAAIEEEVDALGREVTTYEAKYKLDPSVRDANLLVVDTTLAAMIRDDQRALSTAELERDEIEVKISALRQTLEGGVIPARIAAPPPPLDPLALAEVQQLQVRIAALTLQKSIFKPETSYYIELDKRIALAKEELKKKRPLPLEATIPNPDYTAEQQHFDDLVTRRTAILGRIEGLKARIDANERQLRERPQIVLGYRERVSRYEAARQRLYAVEAELDRVAALTSRILASKPYSTLTPAVQPRRPTEPNVTILALVGSLVGLGVAVGLILAFDALRFTYKTLDDLERGLPVPVLGGVSHIETVEERSEVRRGRWVVSILAVSLLFLIVATATIYYVAPARLPTWARDVLDMVLGGGE